ncbi:MAG TPA: hypothetical protein VKR53_01020 [Puia sp.]|nr:hypothetical protein [Puia sp.]
MRIIICFFFTAMTLFVSAQSKLTPTDKFTIEGKVKRPITISVSDLEGFTIKSLPDLVITDHMGAKKHTLTGLRGVLLKDILSKAEIDAENPKVLSEFYFVLAAPDNYKVVFSWNEIFNTETGNNIYVVMEEEGTKISGSADRISIVTLSDLRTGRRHMSNIEKIRVERAK